MFSHRRNFSIADRELSIIQKTIWLTMISHCVAVISEMIFQEHKDVMQ
jgi:hypothetical protein